MIPTPAHATPALACDITDIPVSGVLPDEKALEAGGVIFFDGVFLWTSLDSLLTMTTTGEAAFVGDVDERYKGLAFVGDDLFAISPFDDLLL